MLVVIKNTEIKNMLHQIELFGFQQPFEPKYFHSTSAAIVPFQNIPIHRMLSSQILITISGVAAERHWTHSISWADNNKKAVFFKYKTND